MLRSAWGPAVLLGLLCAGPASARTWRVDKDGSGDYTTIQPAVDAAAPGDTVLIGPGRYLEYAPYNFGGRVETTYVVINKPSLTLRAAAPQTVTIGPLTYTWPSPNEPNGLVVTTAALGCVVESLTIANLPTGIELQSLATVSTCVITGCRNGLIAISTPAPSITATSVTMCFGSGIDCALTTGTATFLQCIFDGPAPALTLSQVPDATIRECQFSNEGVLQLQLDSRATVSRCRLSTGSIIAFDSSLELVDNVIGPTQFNTLHVEGGHVTGTGNLFYAATQATILLRAGAGASLQGNHILPGESYSVRCHSYADATAVLDLRNNWWGSPYGSDIRRWIYDGWDDPEDIPVKVLYFPFADAPVPGETRSFGGLKAGYGER